MTLGVYIASPPFNFSLLMCVASNIGPWVGGPFRQALYERFGPNNVAFQGVSPEDYPADLDGYIEKGGPERCAVSLANAVQGYAARCPSCKFVISGWR